MLDDGHRVIAEAKAILSAKAFMPAEVFKTLLYSAHEDRVSPKWKVRYRTAFQFLKEHERMLAKKPPPPRPAGLPRTWEEWEAAKWHAKEERRKREGPNAQPSGPRRPIRPSRSAVGDPLRNTRANVELVSGAPPPLN
jgi:hypothetical protein